jgi:uncharacterized FlaG/YvyC family protein
MSFEGLQRPLPRTDALSPYTASNLARADNAHMHQIKPLEAEEALKALEREPENPGEQEKEDADHSEILTEDEVHDLRLMAKMRGIMDFSIETGTRFEFHVNPLSGRMELMNADTGELILELTAEEVMRFSHKINRYAGVLMDQAG